jgi:hypothetical protein
MAVLSLQRVCTPRLLQSCFSSLPVILLLWVLLTFLWPRAFDEKFPGGRQSVWKSRINYGSHGIKGIRRQPATAAGIVNDQAEEIKEQHATLVIYVFSGSDPEYANNLRFFVREGIKASWCFHT